MKTLPSEQQRLLDAGMELCKRLDSLTEYERPRIFKADFSRLSDIQLEMLCLLAGGEVTLAQKPEDANYVPFPS